MTPHPTPSILPTLSKAKSLPLLPASPWASQEPAALHMAAISVTFPHLSTFTHLLLQFSKQYGSVIKNTGSGETPWAPGILE